MMRKLTSSSGTMSLPANLPPSLSDPSQPFPKLIVFDLDYTLWDFWCDTHPSPPLKPDPSHQSVTDKHGEAFTFYPCTPGILLGVPFLAAAGRIKLGVASRTHAPSTARDLLKMLHLRMPPPPPAAAGKEESGGGKKRAMGDVFDAGCEIYTGSKVKHLEALSKRTGVAFRDILFFDDEARNRDVERLGVVMKLVKGGVDWEQVGQGVEEWRRRCHTG